MMIITPAELVKFYNDTRLVEEMRINQRTLQVIAAAYVTELEPRQRLLDAIEQNKCIFFNWCEMVVDEAVPDGKWIEANG